MEAPRRARSPGPGGRRCSEGNVDGVWPVASLGWGQKVGSGLSAWVWNVVFVVGAVSGALIAARYYVVGVVGRDRPLARSAAAMFVVFTIAAVLYFWRFW